MLIQLLIILLGIPIILIPLIYPIVKKKKLTRHGYYFIVICLAFTILQIRNEHSNKRKENQLLSDKIELKNNLDSLIIQTNRLSDSLKTLKGTLLSIDKQFVVTNKTVKTLGRINENLQTKIIKSDRPQLILANTKIMGRNPQEKISSIDFTFINQGKRSATNVFGKMYVSYSDTTWDTGTLSVSRSDIFPNNRGFVLHQPMKFEPDVATYEKPIYYYFRLTYSDILLDTLYNFEIAMKVSPALTTELIMCKEWEVDRIRKVLKPK